MRLAWMFPLALCLGCTTAMVKGAEKIRVTANPEIVHGCTYLGEAKAQSNQAGMWGAAGAEKDEENVRTMLRNEALKMGGNIVLLQTSHATGPSLIYRGEVYHCDTLAPEPAVKP